MRTASTLALPLAILALAPAACKSPPERIRPITISVGTSGIEVLFSMVETCMITGFGYCSRKPSTSISCVRLSAHSRRSL